jgi:hypothetical protein
MISETFLYRWFPKDQTQTEPFVDPRDRYLPSWENFISLISNIDDISAAGYPVPTSNINTVFLSKLFKFEAKSPILLYYAILFSSEIRFVVF